MWHSYQAIEEIEKRKVPAARFSTDDEKEFNSLIWRSSQMTRVVASDRNAILTLPVVLSFI